MSNSHGEARFLHCDGDDPALPGDPWSRLRYHYGQLLGADDFQAEQNAIVLRRRLHNALLHGAGTVCGLRVSAGPQTPPQTRLLVSEGLAIDAYGREIYVNEAQCLDIIGLHAGKIWETLALSPDALPADPADPHLSDTRRAYVTLSHEACLSNQVPAITPPCGDASEALAFARINDRFRIDLVAEAPPDPHPLQRDWLAAGVSGEPASARDRWLNFILDCPASGSSLQHFWTAYDQAPLLLAVVDLLHETSIGSEITQVAAIDNSPRALLPAVQATAEHLLRQRLVGADANAALRLLRIADNSEAADATTLPEFSLQFSAELAATTVEDAVTVYALEDGGWSAALAATVTVVGDSVTITLAAAPASGRVLQLCLIGGGSRPLMAASGQPLDGWSDEPLSGPGRGRDINAIRVWTPGAA